MLFDGVDAAASAITNSFSLFSMTTSDSINAIIAVLAFLGLGISLFFSIKALNRTKKMHEQNQAVLRHQNNIAMFDKRYEVFHYFKDFLMSPKTVTEPLTTKDKELLLHYQDKLNYLFTDTLEMNLIINSLMERAFPDKTEEYKKRLTEVNVDGTMTPEQAISYAFGFYATDCLFKFDKQLELIKD